MIRAGLVLVLLLAACGDDGMVVIDADPTVDVAPDAPPREVVMETRALDPGMFIEGIAGMSGTIWNHLPAMLPAFREEGIPYPSISPDEMADLIAYLHGGSTPSE